MDGLEVIDQTTDTDLDLGTQTDQATDPDTAQGDGGKELQQATEDKGEWRRISKDWSQGIKELRELYPNHADMLTKLRNGYGKISGLQEDLGIKSIDDVRQWKTTLDAAGGAEQVAELMQRAATMDQVDAKIEAGDFSVIGELPENLQKGFYQMLPDALADLQTKDPAAFDAAVAPHFQAALLGTNMGEHLKKMYTAAGDNEPLKDLIRQQYDWFQQQTQGSGKMPGGQKTASPEVQRLQAELNTRRENDDKAFVGGVSDTTIKYVGESFAKEAAVYLKQLNLTDAQKADLSDSFNNKLVDKLGKDTAFQKQLAAYKVLKNRNPDTVNTYIRSKIDESAKSILDGLVTARYGGMRRKAPDPAPGTTTTENGATRVAQAPDQSQWDMTKMEQLGYDATVKKGVFHLQGGRTVQLVRQ